MTRIEALFARLRAHHRKALTAFITAGDPNAEVTPRAMHGLVEGGADLIELGVPFSDPEADGPAIQAASMRALSGATPTSLSDVLSITRTFRERDGETPVVLMGYLNSLLAFGVEAFVAQARSSGVDGVILVNLPIEAFAHYKAAFERDHLNVVFLVAPTTGEARARAIAGEASGFLYYVSLKGVTGASHLDLDDLAANTSRLRGLTDMPIQIGFGIRTPEAAQQAAPYADGLIVGSAFVARMGELKSVPAEIPDALRRMAREFRVAIDQASSN